MLFTITSFLFLNSLVAPLTALPRCQRVLCYHINCNKSVTISLYKVARIFSVCRAMYTGLNYTPRPIRQLEPEGHTPPLIDSLSNICSLHMQSIYTTLLLMIQDNTSNLLITSRRLVEPFYVAYTIIISKKSPSSCGACLMEDRDSINGTARCWVRHFDVRLSIHESRPITYLG